MAGTMDILDTIGQLILADKSENSTSSTFPFDEVTFLLGKAPGKDMEGAEYTTKHGSIRLPQALVGFGLDSTSCIQRQVELTYTPIIHPDMFPCVNRTV